MPGIVERHLTENTECVLQIYCFALFQRHSLKVCETCAQTSPDSSRAWDVHSQLDSGALEILLWVILSIVPNDMRNHLFCLILEMEKGAVLSSTKPSVH